MLCRVAARGRAVLSTELGRAVWHGAGMEQYAQSMFCAWTHVLHVIVTDCPAVSSSELQGLLRAWPSAHVVDQRCTRRCRCP